MPTSGALCAPHGGEQLLQTQSKLLSVCYFSFIEDPPEPRRGRQSLHHCIAIFSTSITDKNWFWAITTLYLQHCILVSMVILHGCSAVDVNEVYSIFLIVFFLSYLFYVLCKGKIEQHTTFHILLAVSWFGAVNHSMQTCFLLLLIPLIFPCFLRDDNSMGFGWFICSVIFGPRWPAVTHCTMLQCCTDVCVCPLWQH